MLFNFILSVDLKPYVELSFMPSQLAREQTKIFDRPSIISGCTDLEKWELLIRAVIHHFIQRYGREEVRRWRFTTISQSYVHLNCVRWDDYQDLYETAYRAVKELDLQFSFGGSVCFPEFIEQEEGLPAFLDFVEERNCLPDFIAFQFYPNIYTSDPLFMDYTLSQQSAPAILSEDRNYLTHSLDKLEGLLKQHGISDREIYLEERATLEDVFHGGYGLFTYNSIPKAGYHAMRLISRMGNKMIDSGDCWMLTQKGDDYQLLVYNYCHYSNIYRYRYKRLETPQDAYSV